MRRASSVVLWLAVLLPLVWGCSGKGSGDAGARPDARDAGDGSIDVAAADARQADLAADRVDTGISWETAVRDAVMDGARDAGADLWRRDLPADVRAPDGGSPVFELPPLSVHYVYRLHRQGRPAADYEASILGLVDYQGEPYFKVQVGDFASGPPDGVIFYMALESSPELRVRFKAVEVYYEEEDYLGQPAYSYIFDSPLVGHLDATLHARHSSSVKGKMTYPWGESTVEITVEQELMSYDQSVSVPYGRVDGCWQYHFTMKERVDNGPLITKPVDIWVKSGLGVVKSTMMSGFDEVELVSATFP